MMDLAQNFTAYLIYLVEKSYNYSAADGGRIDS